MQADRGLVEHVHHADQPGADLGGEPDALRLAAGEGVGAAVERQVVQADVDQKAQPVADLLDDLLGDLALGAGQVELVEEGQALVDRQGGQLRQIVLGDEDVPGRFVQPGALAARAGLGRDEARQLLAHGVRLGLAVAPLHVADHAFERMRLAPDTALVAEVGKLDLLLAAAVQQNLPGLFGQRVPGRFQVEAVVPAQGADHLKVVGVAPVPAAHRAGGERQLRVSDHLVRVEELLYAQAVAGRAGARRDC